MYTEIENKRQRQNWGSHLKNIHGSAFRKAWISNWLDQPENNGRHYKDAVDAYIQHKSDIADRWAEPVKELLASAEPWTSYIHYQDLLANSKANVNTVAKALAATVYSEIEYTKCIEGNWTTKTHRGWIQEGEKYLTELIAPSGKTGKWIQKLQILCEQFQKIENEQGIMPGLMKIIKHCKYPAGNPEKNDKLPLYMYPAVQEQYDDVARRLLEFSGFVLGEMANGHRNE